MVFINGVPLTLVSSQSQVKSGDFYVNYSTKTIYIGSNPTGNTVEATDQATALDINSSASGTIVRGLGFEHYATSYSYQQAGALWVDATSVTVENCTFAYNALAGLAVYSQNCTNNANTCAFNGEKGLEGKEINGTLVENNAFAYNNQRNFAQNWDAGGSKICNSTNETVKNNLYDSNICDGIWFDISCSNITIVGNVVLNSAREGIEYEISSNAIIADITSARKLLTNHSYGVSLPFV
jgi:mannuronan 5-epimerase